MARIQQKVPAKWVRQKPRARLSIAAQLVRAWVELGSVDRVAKHYGIPRERVHSELAAGGVDLAPSWSAPGG
jgi:hypothetical protein